MEDPLVRQYINANFEGAWPLDWFVRQLDGRRFGRALSIGCGTGALERALMQQSVCDRIDAFDASLQSLAEARRQADAAGLGKRIRYYAADFNSPFFIPHRYDAIFVHQALHHVEHLERLLAAVMRSLKPGGLLYLDEYVGPSRIDWKRSLMRDVRQLHESLEPEWRLHEELNYPVQADDPSEAVRSGDILSQLKIGFVTREMRGYGGNVLSIIFPEVRWQAAPDTLLSRLITADAAVAERNGPYCAVILAEPRRGLSGLLARLAYGSGVSWLCYRWRRFLRPRLLRIRLGLLRRAGLPAKW
jgi:SAM-dependent methyltransferase